MSTRDTDRMKFLALKLRARVPLTEAEQAEWDRDALLCDRVAAGLPLTEDERAKIERAKDAIVSVRNGALWVEAPQVTPDQWKARVAASRAAPAKLVADDAGTDKQQSKPDAAT